MRAVLEDTRRMAASDWRVAPVPWDQSLHSPGRKLRIAYYEDDGLFPPMPGVKRALQVYCSCPMYISQSNESLGNG